MGANNTKKNSGFTLVELLIAITILAIIVIPLLHAFVSSARTNQKAYMTMRSTSIAENIMEEFEDASMAELENKYGVTQNPDGTYLFDFTATDLSEFGNDSFTAQVALDPNTSYQSQNEKAMIDIATISGVSNAVYSMGEVYDESIYTIFEKRSDNARQSDNLVYQYRDAAWFRKALYRTILVDIKKGPMITDTEGNTFPSAKVTVEITYEYRNNNTEKVLLADQTKYTVKKDLFDNTSTQKPLNGIYIMYTPRYEACSVGGKKDEILVKNDGNVEANLFLICQETTPTADGIYRDSYFQLQKAELTVYENPAWSGALTDATQGALKLRTNLHTTPNPTSGIASLCFNLKYSNNMQTVGTAVAEKILDTKRPDGKALDGKALKERIYKMKVSVFRVGETQPLSVLEGTKID